EWFKFNNINNERYYNHFGKSYNILDAMLKYAKKFNINIIISDAVYKLSELNLNVRMLDRIKIPNLNNPIRVFELISDEQKDNHKNIVEYFHAGLKLFESKKFDEASMYFKQCLKINSNDTPSKIYLNRCKDLIHNPPDEKWDATFEITDQ
ncbi:MAG TPA: hypothetical protein PK771_08595, partial [Spirochaetota bacterium]|nr:hypothetical protein [Spirochaetota bacterium]